MQSLLLLLASKQIITFISALSVILPCTGALIRWRTLDRALVLLACFFLLSVVFDFYSIYSSAKRINNIRELYIYTLIEFVSYGAFYLLLSPKGIARRLMLYSMIAYTLFGIYHFIYIARITEFDISTRVLESILITAYGLNFLYTLFKADNFVKLYTYPYFWITSGVLLYFMGNSFLFLLYEMMGSQDPAMAKEYWRILHSILNIAANIFYLMGFLCSPRLQK